MGPCNVLLFVCFRPTKRIGEEESMMRVRTKEGLQHQQQQPGNDDSCAQDVMNIRPCFGQDIHLNESFLDKMILTLGNGPERRPGLT